MGIASSFLFTMTFRGGDCFVVSPRNKKINIEHTIFNNQIVVHPQKRLYVKLDIDYWVLKLSIKYLSK